jgi:hypothetical protein
MTPPPPDGSGRAKTSRSRRGLIGAILVTVLFAVYVYAIAGRSAAMIRTGEPVLIAIGIGVLLIPLVVLGLLVKEWSLATTVQRMADELAAADELPVDDLPRSPGGRIDRAAADAAFAVQRERVEQEPESWRARYLLAFAYDASGDRKRARATLRTAAALYRGKKA